MKKTIFFLNNNKLPITKPGFVDPGIIFGKFENVKWVEHVENKKTKSVFFFRDGKVQQYNSVK